MDEGRGENVLVVGEEGVREKGEGKGRGVIVDKEDVVEVGEIEGRKGMGEEWVVRCGLEGGDGVMVWGLEGIGGGMKGGGIWWSEEKGRREWKE